MKRVSIAVAVILALLGTYLLVDGGAGRPSAGGEGESAAGGQQPIGDPSTDPLEGLPDPVASAGESARPYALALEGEGLRLFHGETGSARPVPFGTSVDGTWSALSASAGTSIVEEGDSAECGNQFARLENGLTIWMRGGRFVGWSLREPPLGTASGIGIGSSRADLERAYDARVVESSLGVEFTAGALAGLLESTESDARILNLWAGETTAPWRVQP